MLNFIKNTQRSRRLRKKLYLGEFAVYGFEASCQLQGLDEQGFDAFLDDCIAFVESRNLALIGGGGQEEFSAYIMAWDRYRSPTEEDRQAFRTWLEQQPKASNIEVHELRDAHHDFD